MARSVFKYSLYLSAFATLGSAQAIAQDNNTILPDLPAPIQSLANEGAQIRFLGKDEGLDGWIAIKNGQEQYFYVNPITGGFVTGILFNKDGKTVTIDQVSRLRGQSEGAFLDQLTADAPPSSVTETAQQQAEKYEFKTPSEQLYFDIENSNWVPIGQAGTPIVYSFIDPQCPHCHEMMRDLRNDIQAGRLQVRLIPVGFKEESKAQAAYLLATPGPEEVWWRHLDGDKEVLPAKRQINEQGVQRNLSVMQSWKLSVTPLMVYRAKDGSVKIIRGKPKDVPSFIGDLGART